MLPANLAAANAIDPACAVLVVSNTQHRETDEVIVVGAFRVFPRGRMLKMGDEAVKLGSRAFDILLALAETPGEIVSHRELLAKVWPNVYVEDVSLRVHMAALRKVLEDRDKGQAYLTSVPGRGYKLIAPTSKQAVPSVREGHQPPQSAPRLPRAVQNMVGREDEVRAISANLLAQRFVNIVGPGGVGKTTVALSVAHALRSAFDGAVHFVDFSPVGEPHLLAAAIATAVGLTADLPDLVAGIAKHLRGRRLLLVLDGCEHLISETAAIAQQLFAELHDLHILCTSREALRAGGEHIHFLPALLCPPDDAELDPADALNYPSVQLFAKRMVGAGRDSSDLSRDEARTVGEICRKLGGIALAIELAASHAAVYGVEDTAAMLDTKFALLWPGRRTAPPRHQTLGATLDWSFNLLSGTERAVLLRLSVFPGGFAPDAARYVAHASTFESEAFEAVNGLIAKSLVVLEPTETANRYRLLDTTRAYARTKLEDSGDSTAVYGQYACYVREMLRAATDARSDLRAPSDGDIDDVRAALRWAFGPGGDVSLGIDIAACAAPWWLGRALLSECRDWLAKAAAAAGIMAPQQELRLQIAHAAAELFSRGFTNETQATWQRTLERARAIEDVPAQFQSHLVLWGSRKRAAQYQEALDTAQECADLAKATADPGGLAMGEWMLGRSLHHVGRFDESRLRLGRYFSLETESAYLASIRATGYDRRVDASAVLSSTLWILGYPGDAGVWAKRAVAYALASGLSMPLGVAMSWVCLNTYLSATDIGEIERDSVALLEQGRAHSIDSDSGFGLCLIGFCRALRGQFDKATPLISEGLGLLAQAHMEAFSVLVLAHTCEHAIKLKRVDEAMRWMVELQNKDKNYEHWCSSEVLRVRGLLAELKGDHASARKHFTLAIDLARQQQALAWELRAALSLSTLLQKQGRGAAALSILEPVYKRFQDGTATRDLASAKDLIAQIENRNEMRTA